MFRSLRSRLSLTYLLLISIVFCMALLVVTLLVRNIPSRTTSIRLQELARLALPVEQLEGLPQERQAAILKNIAERFEVRIIVLDAGGSVQLDTGAGKHPPIERLPRPAPPPPGGGQGSPPGTVRDAENHLWHFVVRPLSDGRSLVLAAPRPSIQWLNILTDDLLPPLLWSTGVAILLAILVAGLTARWVSDPLRHMVAATRRVAGGEYTPIEESGPEEVMQLARAFNDMVTTVRAGQQSQRDFVANVSHELKTPLTAIQGFAQAIRDGTASSEEEIDRAASVIHDEAGRMHRLVVDLLDLARIEGEGAASFAREPVDLKALLEIAAARFAPQARAARVDLQTRLEALPLVRGDGDRLLQVFSNLLDNAVKHTPPGGTVTLSAGAEETSALVSIADTGPGIPKKEQARIFERFYQLDKSRARAGQGSGFGLGLAIAKEIVQAHAGRLWVESEPGRGSVFVVKIPFNQAEN